MNEKIDINIKIKNIKEYHSIALKEFLTQMVILGNIGRSKWLCFYSDGDGDFRPKIEIDGRELQKTDESIITNEDRFNLWKTGEFRMDFDLIAQKLHSGKAIKE